MGTELTPADELAVLKAVSARPPRRVFLPFVVGFLVTAAGCHWLADVL